MTDFQSEQLDYDRSGDRTHDLNHRSTLIIPLRHRPLSAGRRRFFLLAHLNRLSISIYEFAGGYVCLFS